ncbi:complement C1q tumor necrosis factor-related protein 3-like [Dreissena polymorpha]|uniref:C1q domain-containing protein n=1 Tax=Dreissena polymorpha TaxID=45954 RepID=A0A9D4MS96_DREPO|nr:complement C1q tumor necrosis factor-related protein 3-like [Dreissena polymorpha]KAH3881290.1 hypothetical protein DPMN_005215 [Dreissena polymorpha]
MFKCSTLVMLASVMSGIQAFLLDDNSLQNLINLISAEKKMRAQVEADIRELDQNIKNLQNDHTISLCKCPATGVIAFSASLTNDISNFGSLQPLVFDHVTTNVGGAYDARHGTFRVPVTGVYQFTVSAQQGTATTWIGLELVVDGQAIARVKTGDNGYYNQATNVVSARVTSGSDVWVRHMTVSDNNRVVGDGGFFTSFSGYLISAD